MAGEEDQPPVWIEERPRRRRLYASRRARICSCVLPLQKGAWVEYQKTTWSFCKIETFLQKRRDGESRDSIRALFLTSKHACALQRADKYGSRPPQFNVLYFNMVSHP